MLPLTIASTAPATATLATEGIVAQQSRPLHDAQPDCLAEAVVVLHDGFGKAVGLGVVVGGSSLLWMALVNLLRWASHLLF